jgi:hypothetical protein
VHSKELIDMKRILTAAMVAFVLAAVVHAQAKMSGKWQGETKNGSQILLDVKLTETTLTGTLTVDGEPYTISDGKVAKTKFTFTATAKAEAFAGELAEDQITIWMEKRGPSSAAVLKRVKSDKK